MLDTFLEKAEGLLNKRFLVAYWFPVLVCLGADAALRGWVYGWSATLGTCTAWTCPSGGRASGRRCRRRNRWAQRMP